MRQDGDIKEESW